MCMRLPFRTNFLTDTSDFFCELSKFVHHGVNDILELHHDDALDGDGNLLGQVAECNGLINERETSVVLPKEEQHVPCTRVLHPGPVPSIISALRRRSCHFRKQQC